MAQELKHHLPRLESIAPTIHLPSTLLQCTARRAMSIWRFPDGTALGGHWGYPVPGPCRTDCESDLAGFAAKLISCGSLLRCIMPMRSEPLSDGCARMPDAVIATDWAVSRRWPASDKERSLANLPGRRRYLRPLRHPKRPCLPAFRKPKLLCRNGRPTDGQRHC